MREQFNSGRPGVYRKKQKTQGELKAEIEVMKECIRHEVNASQRTRKEAALRELARQLVMKMGSGR